ncbi:hypothetical protein E2C01_015900 [Portunus trituberculatus]|uniref:Secreted protein n=1 Tax=Portunus trituberculatus TaxID=210409 RepID=A0A5B7DPH9_PORTR|nr:hypothetical protein [Portunus trituberculatus]
MTVCVCVLSSCIVQGWSGAHSVLSPCLHLSIFFFKVMHIMCCNNFITQCIPLFHCSMWKTVLSNILHTLPHPNLLYMSSSPSSFCHQHQVNVIYHFIHY